MQARLALTLTILTIAMAVVVPSAFATTAAPPVALAPGEKVVSHSTTAEKDSQYVVDLLSAIKGVKIGADKTTVLVDNGGKTHPIEIEYGDALKGTAKASASPAAGTSGVTGGASGSGADAAGAAGSSAGGGLGLGQIAGLLLGLTVVSRVVGIVRQMGGGGR